MCIYIYIYVYLHICTHTHTHTCTYIYVYTSMYTYIIMKTYVYHICLYELKATHFLICVDHKWSPDCINTWPSVSSKRPLRFGFGRPFNAGWSHEGIIVNFFQEATTAPPPSFHCSKNGFCFKSLPGKVPFNNPIVLESLWQKSLTNRQHAGSKHGSSMKKGWNDTEQRPLLHS